LADLVDASGLSGRSARLRRSRDANADSPPQLVQVDCQSAYRSLLGLSSIWKPLKTRARGVWSPSRTVWTPSPVPLWPSLGGRSAVSTASCPPLPWFRAPPPACGSPPPIPSTGRWSLLDPHADPEAHPPRLAQPRAWLFPTFVPDTTAPPKTWGHTPNGSTAACSSLTPTSGLVAPHPYLVGRLPSVRETVSPTSCDGHPDLARDLCGSVPHVPLFGMRKSSSVPAVAQWEKSRNTNHSQVGAFAMSSLGGTPNLRAYSRLNWLELS
jgi:hypothetical protein